MFVSNCNSRSDTIYYESQLTLYIHIHTCLQGFIVGFPVGVRISSFLQNFGSIDLLTRNYNVKKYKSPIRILVGCLVSRTGLDDVAMRKFIICLERACCQKPDKRSLDLPVANCEVHFHGRSQWLLHQ